MILLVFLDCLSVFLAFHFAMLSRFGTCQGLTFWLTFGFLFLITFSVFLYQNLYDRKRYVNQTKIFLKIVISSFYIIILYILVCFFTKFRFLELSRIGILLFFVYFLGLNIVFRILIVPSLFEKWFGRQERKRKVEIFAGDKHREKIISMLQEYPILGFQNCDITKEECTNTAFLWCEGKDLSIVYSNIKEKLKKYVLIEAVIPAFQNLRMEPTWTRIGDMPVWEFNRGNHRRFTDCAIRLFDILGSILAIILLGIPMLIVALLVRIDSGSPVLFRQERVGKDGKLFTFLKFRSMQDGTSSKTHKGYMKTLINGEKKDGEIFKPEENKEITRFGRFIRKTSIDELPQFFNVLKGDMSIVGPRPPIPYEVEMYKEWHKERLKIKPGITGAWQVFGRSSLPFDKSVFLDLYYKENRCWTFNFYLFLKTIPRVLTSVGAE